MWVPVVDSEDLTSESLTLPALSSPPCCDFAGSDEGASTPQPVRRVVARDCSVLLEPGQIDTVWEK